MHFLRKRSLSRRTMLRGLVGGGLVAVALPPLEAMLDANGEALANGEPLPKRFISFFSGNGFILDEFEPTQAGADWQLSPLLEPLAPVKEHINLCTGLANRCEDLITHHEGITAFTAHSFIARGDLPGFASDAGGPSIDQVIADALARQATLPVRSIQIGVSKFDSPADNGTNADTHSFRGEPGNLTPLPPEANPLAVWETLFGEFVPKPDDRQLRMSILDVVREDARRLGSQLGTKDNQRLDAHLQALAELEQKIAAMPPTCEIPGMPTLANDEVNGQERLVEVNQVMADLVAMAFVCDITRVASYRLVPLAGEAVLSEAEPASSDTHHVVSHNAEYSQSARDEFRSNIRFVMARLNDLIATLSATNDVEGNSLLDSSIVYATSDCAVGWNHTVRRHPVILAGSGGGYLKQPGIHYRAIENDPDDPNGQNDNGMSLPTTGNVSDVLLAVLQNYDPEATEIGSGDPRSETPLTDILA